MKTQTSGLKAKLTLNKMTLANLSNESMAKIAGGVGDGGDGPTDPIGDPTDGGDGYYPTAPGYTRNNWCTFYSSCNCGPGCDRL